MKLVLRTTRCHVRLYPSPVPPPSLLFYLVTLASSFPQLLSAPVVSLSRTLISPVLSSPVGIALIRRRVELITRRFRHRGLSIWEIAVCLGERHSKRTRRLVKGVTKYSRNYYRRNKSD